MSSWILVLTDQQGWPTEGRQTEAMAINPAEGQQSNQPNSANIRFRFSRQRGVVMTHLIPQLTN